MKEIALPLTQLQYKPKTQAHLKEVLRLVERSKAQQQIADWKGQSREGLACLAHVYFGLGNGLGLEWTGMKRGVARSL